MSSVPAGAAAMFAQEQFRMRRLQVYNWGTFSGIHEIPVSERGFLFVGPLALANPPSSMPFPRYWSPALDRLQRRRP